AALAELTVEALVGGRNVRIDPVLQFSHGDEELARLLHAAFTAKDQCRAEAYYCKFIPPATSLKGHLSRHQVAIYVDAQHSFILGGDAEVDRIVNGELARRVAGEKQPTLPPSEVGRVLANWIDQANAGPGQLSPGICPAEWAATRFLDWWREQVAQ